MDGSQSSPALHGEWGLLNQDSCSFRLSHSYWSFCSLVFPGLFCAVTQNGFPFFVGRLWNSTKLKKEKEVNPNFQPDR